MKKDLKINLWISVWFTVLSMAVLVTLWIGGAWVVTKVHKKISGEEVSVWYAMFHKIN